MIKKKAKQEEVVNTNVILGIVVDNQIIEKFSVNTPRLASLFLSNPTFIELEE